jgi:hypothetical protein
LTNSSHSGFIENPGKIHYIRRLKKKKPALPERRYGTPYSVGWPDKGVHTRNVDYKVFAFDKKGQRICELRVFWEKSPNKDSLKAGGSP